MTFDRSSPRSWWRSHAADRGGLARAVDLARAGALLRFRVARDGRALFERDRADSWRFRVEAISFWCDAGPIIRPGCDSVLEDVARWLLQGRR